MNIKLEYCKSSTATSASKMEMNTSLIAFEPCLLHSTNTCQAVGCSYSIIKDKEFKESRLVLNGKAIQLRENWKGKKSKKTDLLTAEEEEILWNTGVLGGVNPKSLNHTVFYIISQHFGTRGRQEHHQIRVEHLRLFAIHRLESQSSSNGRRGSRKLDWVAW